MLRKSSCTYMRDIGDIDTASGHISSNCCSSQIVSKGNRKKLARSRAEIQNNTKNNISTTDTFT